MREPASAAARAVCRRSCCRSSCMAGILCQPLPISTALPWDRRRPAGLLTPLLFCQKQQLARRPAGRRRSQGAPLPARLSLVIPPHHPLRLPPLEPEIRLQPPSHPWGAEGFPDEGAGQPGVVVQGGEERLVGRGLVLLGVLAPLGVGLHPGLLLRGKTH